MRRVLVVIALTILLPAPAGAEDWTYCKKGFDAGKAGDNDLAIEYFTRCLNEGDLILDNKALTHRNRGVIYRRKGAYDRAIADFDRAVRLDPDYAEAYFSRGITFGRKSAHIQAMADYDRALYLDPGYVAAKKRRGRTHFYLGQFEQAVPDLRQAAAAKPGNVYRDLWLYLAQARAGQRGRADLRDNTRHFDHSNWPGPVVRMFLGEMDVQVFLEMGEADKTVEDMERRTEVYFYAGQYQLLAGNTDKATAYFREVVNIGVTYYNEYTGATAELNRYEQ